MDLKNLEVDPFDEFEEFEEYDDDLTIETERDFFDEFDQSDLESVPEYDSKSGKIIEGSEPISKAENKDNKVDEDNIALMKTIDEVDVSNVKNAVKKHLAAVVKFLMFISPVYPMVAQGMKEA